MVYFLNSCLQERCPTDLKSKEVLQEALHLRISLVSFPSILTRVWVFKKVKLKRREFFVLFWFICLFVFSDHDDDVFFSDDDGWWFFFLVGCYVWHHSTQQSDVKWLGHITIPARQLWDNHCRLASYQKVSFYLVLLNNTRVYSCQLEQANYRYYCGILAYPLSIRWNWSNNDNNEVIF